MTRLFRSLAPALLLPLLGSAASVPPHLQQAQLIANQIDQSFNEYAHKNCFIHWKGESGATRYENRTDCSDFLDLLLMHSYQVTEPQMQRWTGRDRPLAETWFDTIEKGRGFEIVHTIDQMQPGDVIAIKYPPGAGDTGHIMLVASQPKRRTAAAPIEPRSVQWELSVIDSSKSGHGSTDTRRESDGTYHTGVGEGVIRLYGDANNQILGYAWSTASISKFEPATDRKIVVGHLQWPSN